MNIKFPMIFAHLGTFHTQQANVYLSEKFRGRNSKKEYYNQIRSKVAAYPT